MDTLGAVRYKHCAHEKTRQQESRDRNHPGGPGGGRAAARRALYMAALCATRSNRQLREFYQRLRAAGKPAKVALTAVMRKLVVLMNHVLKNPNFSLAT